MASESNAAQEANSRESPAREANDQAGENESRGVEEHQSDNASSADNDHVREKETPVVLTKRQKVKRHCGRFWWWYLIAVVILLAILLPILFEVIIPKIVQDIVSDQKIPVNGGGIQALSATQLNMTLETTLDTPLAARMAPMDMNLYNKDLDTFSPFITLRLPETHVNGETDLIITNQTVDVLDEAELTRWFDAFFDEKSTSLSIQADASVHLGELGYAPELDKTIEIPSLNYLDGFALEDMQFVVPPDDRGYNVRGNLNIPNSGALSLGLGNLSFNLFAGDINLSLVNIYDVVLQPGDNPTAFDGEFYFHELVPNLSDILDSQKESLGQGTLRFHATGNTSSVYGERVKYIENVLNKKRIPMTVSVVTMLADLMNGFLLNGEGDGSLLDSVGQAVGNQTLFEQLMGHWGERAGGNGTDESATSRVKKRVKSRGKWMWNVLRLGLGRRKA